MEMMLLLLLGSVKSTLWTTLLLTPNEYFQTILEIDLQFTMTIAATTDYSTIRNNLNPLKDISAMFLIHYKLCTSSRFLSMVVDLRID